MYRYFYIVGATLITCACVCAPSFLTLCHPMACSPPGSSVRGISQGRILEWVAIFSSRGSSRRRYQTCVSRVGRWILHRFITWEAPH